MNSLQGLTKKKFEHRMKEFAKAAWATMEAMHQVLTLEPVCKVHILSKEN